MFDDNKQLRGGFLRNVVLLSGVGVAAWAQGAFVYQYDGMNETNRVEVTSVKVSGVNRTLTWKADRDYRQCGVPVYLLPLLERPTPERLRRCALCWDAISKMNGKSGLYYAINRRGELLGDAFGHMAQLRDHAMMRRTAITIYYGIQSLQKMESLGVAIKPEWKESVRKACDGVVAVWQRYGQLGQYIKADSGEIHAPNSTNGALVPGALALASEYFDNPTYMDVARATGRYLYDHDLAKGYCGGGPAEILEAPDSESSCELGESFIALWEITGNREWVEKAKAAAAMYASWVEAFDYAFPKTSRMGQLGIKATRSVWASVQNRHSAPGPYVMSADWLVKLSRATGDSRYAQVFYDTALNIAQYATTEKNHFMPKGTPARSPSASTRATGRGEGASAR